MTDSELTFLEEAQIALFTYQLALYSELDIYQINILGMQAGICGFAEANGLHKLMGYAGGFFHGNYLCSDMPTSLYLHDIESYERALQPRIDWLTQLVDYIILLKQTDI